MLEIKHVTKKYYGKKGIFDINLQIEAGSIVGILGRNGSGKTTLLRAVLGLLKIDEGSITYNDEAVEAHYADIAFISEGGSFLSYMNAKEYSKFLCDYYPSFEATAFFTYLKDFEISEESAIRSLSKGQQLRLEIAAGFAMKAKLIILDEPFTTLDVYAKEDTVKLLIQQFQEDSIILISTHNIEDIEQVIDRCILLNEGYVVEDVAMDELHQQDMDIKALLDKYRK